MVLNIKSYTQREGYCKIKNPIARWDYNTLNIYPIIQALAPYLMAGC